MKKKLIIKLSQKKSGIVSKIAQLGVDVLENDKLCRLGNTLDRP